MTLESLANGVGEGVAGAGFAAAGHVEVTHFDAVVGGDEGVGAGGTGEVKSAKRKS